MDNIHVLRDGEPIRQDLLEMQSRQAQAEVQAARTLWDFDARGEQPESPIHSDPGALRGDVPLSRTSESEDN